MLACAVLVASSAFAQGGVILKGGVNSANISITDDGKVDDAKSLTTFHVGIATDFMLVPGVSIQPALLFTGKGSKTQQGSESDASYYRASSNPFYVELPVNLIGKIPLGGTTRLMIGAGPYAAMGVTGKNKVEGRVFGAGFKRENDIKFSNDDPTTANEENAGYGKLKRFDYGLNGLAGFDFGKLQLMANYGYGFTKLNSGTNNRDNDNNKHRILSLSLGIEL